MNRPRARQQVPANRRAGRTAAGFCTCRSPGGTPVYRRRMPRASVACGGNPRGDDPQARPLGAMALDRKSVVEGKSVSVRVDLGGRRIINKKKHTTTKILNRS